MLGVSCSQGNNGIKGIGARATRYRTGGIQVLRAGMSLNKSIKTTVAWGWSVRIEARTGDRIRRKSRSGTEAANGIRIETRVVVVDVNKSQSGVVCDTMTGTE